MPGDIGKRLLNDSVGGPVHRGRHVTSLSLDVSVASNPVVRARSTSSGMSSSPLLPAVPIVAQRLQGCAQFPGRLTTGLPDRQQGLRHLLTSLTGHVDGGLGLHLDDRDLVGERIVQFARDVQPLLVGAAPRGLLPGALGLVRPPLGLSQRLTRGTGRDQPGKLKGASGLRERLTRVVERGQGSERERREHGHRGCHREHAVPRPHGGVHRDEERDGGHIETEGLISQCAQSGDGQHDDRCPAVRGQHQTAARQQHETQRIEIRGGVLPRQPGGQRARRYTDGDRPISDPVALAYLNPSRMSGCATPA